MAVINLYKITVNIKNKTLGQLPQITANDSVVFDVEVYDDTSLFSLSPDYIYMLVTKKRSGKSVIREGSLVDGLIRFELGSSEMTEPGKVEATVQILDETNKRVSTARFDYVIAADPSTQGGLPTDDKTLVIANESTLLETIQKSENATQKAEEQKQRVDELIANTPQPSEVVDARGGEVVLGNRLNKIDALMAQTETKKADKDYVDTKFGNLGNRFTFKGTCTFIALPASGMQIGDYWYVTDKTTNYAYNGSAWVDIGNNLNIGKNAIVPENTTFIDKVVGTNLFNRSTAVNGTVAWWNTGVDTPLADNYGSDFIPVVAGQQYTRSTKQAITFWDKDKKFMFGYNTGHADNALTITIPNGCYYVKLAIYTVNIDTYMFVKGSVLPSTFIPYEEAYKFKAKLDLSNANVSSNQWQGKTVIFQGDSITDHNYNSGLEYRYPEGIVEELAFGKSFNYAISGSTIAINTSDPTGRNPIVSRYQTMDDTADLLIVAAGTNDWFYTWTPLGDMNNRSNNTFYGALHNLCLGLLKKYKHKTILFMTPIMRRQGSLNAPNSVNGNGKTLKEYGDIIKEVCRYYGIPVLDMYGESGLFPFDDELAVLYYTQQGTSPDYYYTHPNGNGQRMMKKRLSGYLRELA